ncbi:MAG: hypothetical protein R6X20_04525 [Phycisphaerae bacterium]
MAHKAPARRRKRAAQVAVAGALLAVALAVLLVKATPGVYERTAPLGRDRNAFRAFNRRVVNHVGNVLLDESGGTRLDLAVTEAMVNARLAMFLGEERRAGRPVPAVLARLRVGFEPGAVVLATQLGDGWSEVVAAQWLRLSADGHGRLVTEPAGTRIGSLPLPGMEGALRAAVMSTALAPQGDKATHLDVLKAILRAWTGKPVALGKGDRRIVLESVEVDRGVLRMQGHRAVD